MNLTASGWVDLEMSQLFVKGLKGVLSLLMGVILLALSVGVVKTAWDLHLFWTEDLEVALRRVITDVLILLAVVEVFRTLLAYFTEGRVKVTFIVDTVLVVMLTEVISLWFKGGGWGMFGSISLLLLTLGMMRIITVRYSPVLKIDQPGDV
jgi:uncharacterized membrane protein (DUF373 family)